MPSVGDTNEAVICTGREIFSRYLWRNAIFLAAFALLKLPLPVNAGTVISLDSGTETQGKLTLTSTSVEIQAPAPTEIKLSDVLEARFDDKPFDINFFSSATESAEVATGLPTGWKAQDVGSATKPGSVAFEKGGFVLTGAQGEGDESGRHFTMAGLSWTGDGQWTIRIPKIEAEGFVRAGFMLRDTLEPVSANIGMATWDNNNAYMFARSKTGSTWGTHFEAHDYPQWFRMTRRANSISFEFSNDGIQWQPTGQGITDVNPTAWLCLFYPDHAGAAVEKMVVDHVLLTPPPGLLLASGVLLRSGSFVYGWFDPLDFFTETPTGKFTRGDHTIELSSTLACAAIYLPIERSRILEVQDKTGVLLRNLDFMEGNFEAINRGGVRLNSIAVGTTTFERDALCAAVLHPLQPLPAPYEVRLHDNSRIQAKGIDFTGDQAVIHEISGVDLPASRDEIAQVRAGSAKAQDLLDLPWKASLPAGFSAPEGIESNAVCWTGFNQEQMLVLWPGARVEFPLKDTFRSLVLRYVLPPHCPPQAQVSLHILADGKEILHTPSLKAGEPPRLVQTSLRTAKILTIVAESSEPGVRVLLIDPVAIRATTSP